MSTILYALLRRPKKADEGKISYLDTGKPGASFDAKETLLALVPSETLAAHAAMVTFVTSSATAEGEVVTTIKNIPFLVIGSAVLFALPFVFYYLPRKLGDKWVPLDWLHASIPVVAFAGWVTLQSPSVFDVIFPGVAGPLRLVIATFIAAALSMLMRYMREEEEDSPADPPTEAATP